MSLAWWRGEPEITDDRERPFVYIPESVEQEYTVNVPPGLEAEGQPAYVWFGNVTGRGRGALLPVVRRFGLLDYTYDEDGDFLDEEEAMAACLHLVLLLWYSLQESDASVLRRAVQLLEARPGYPHLDGITHVSARDDRFFGERAGLLESANAPGNARWDAAQRLLSGVLMEGWIQAGRQVTVSWSRKDGLRAYEAFQVDSLFSAVLRDMCIDIFSGVRIQQCANEYCSRRQFFRPMRAGRKYCSRVCQSAVMQRRFQAKRRNRDRG